MSWLRRLLSARSVPRIGALELVHSERLSAIHAGAFARPWSPGEFEAFLLDRAVRADGVFLGRSRLPVGFALSRIAADEAEILSVALLRTVRGRNLSRMLLLIHLQELADRGVATVHLEVEEGNVPALALYRRVGFAQSGLRPGYYQRPDGSRAAAMSMSRRIDRPLARVPGSPPFVARAT